MTLVLGTVVLVVKNCAVGNIPFKFVIFGVGEQAWQIYFNLKQTIQGYIRLYLAKNIKIILTLNCRTSAGSHSSSRIHPENVPRTKPGQGQDTVPSLYLRHRHREHPLRLCGRQRHHPKTQPEGVQPSVKRSRTGEEAEGYKRVEGKTWEPR